MPGLERRLDVLEKALLARPERTVIKIRAMARRGHAFVPRRYSLPDGVIVERDTGETPYAFERRVSALALAGSPQDLVVTVYSFDGDEVPVNGDAGL
jgi:hypothetical protein